MTRGREARRRIRRSGGTVRAGGASGHSVAALVGGVECMPVAGEARSTRILVVRAVVDDARAVASEIQVGGVLLPLRYTDYHTRAAVLGCLAVP